MHEYLLILFGLYIWEVVHKLMKSRHKYYTRQFWAETYDGLTTKENGWAMSIVIGFDDELAVLLFGTDAVLSWWEYILFGFLYDVLVKVFIKNK